MPARPLRSTTLGGWLFAAVLVAAPAHAQHVVDEDDLGAWYMLFGSKRFEDSPWGVQGDLQWRTWDGLEDLEQLLVRGGVTYTPERVEATFTLGYANITSGAFGDSDSTSQESRIYQEALLPHHLGDRFYLRHRFRAEQRFVEDQDYRTRFRYALFIDIPLTGEKIEEGVVYAAIYDEIFLNGEKNIGNGQRVERFDRNRLYGAIGYAIRRNIRVQGGYMQQSSPNVDKGQFQLSLHGAF